MDARTDLVAPDDIDVDYAPRLVADLFETEVDGELIVVGGAARVVVLNPTAAMILGFLDGESTLAELVNDLSDGLGADPDVVQADVLEFARELGRHGLLDGVGRADERPDPGDWTLPKAVDVGAALPAVELVGLDGARHALAEFRGRRVLLVNWSPGCGFCVKIAPELAAAVDALEAEGVALVLLASGTAQRNRELLAEVGLRALVLLRDGTEDDPFRGTGTPAAYLLDEDGRVARAMVVGADHVPVLVADLTGAAAEPGDAGGLESGVRYLPAPAAMCGPGGGAGGSNATEWAGTRAYRFGQFHVGVRFDTEATARVLDRLFPGARVADHRVPDNYSVSLAHHAARPAGARALHLLVRGNRQLVRSRSGARVLAGLLAHLSAELAAPDPSLVTAAATAAVWEESAVLLPAQLTDRLALFQPRLNRAGIRLVDAPYAVVDLATCELVVTEPAIAFDQSVVDELAATDPPLDSELPRVAPGRYPVRMWCFARNQDEAGPLSPARAVAAALPSISGTGDDGLHDRVMALASCFGAVAARGVSIHEPGAVVAQILSGALGTGNPGGA